MARSNTEKLIHLWNDIKAGIYTLFLSHSFYAFGRKSMIIPPFRFGHLSSIELGSHVTIHSNCWIQVLKSDENENLPVIKIKDHVAIGMNTTISAVKSIVIEEYVFTARNVYISDHEHIYDDISVPISRQSIGGVSEVKIGAHTWLGQNSIVLPGVTIGRHCVIGANAVVNRDIPDYTIAVGVPARILKRYNSETQSWVRV
jgi:acetyltransferase-like isoleucine patch superfamily enzyme